ncbi:MAG: hypothetical protein LAN62_04310 [Acidobacteriia bacterium]|nr:hypothetical protein [Terriglobia bacterium]
MGAEETVYADADVLAEPPADRDVEAVTLEALPASEPVEDEALPFEVRDGARSRSSVSEGEAAATGDAKEDSPAEKPSQEPGRDAGKRQARLPGL